MDLIDFIVQKLMRPFTETIFKSLNDMMFYTGFYNTFYIERTIGFTEKFSTVLEMVIICFSFALLSAKLLRKLFDIYIIGVDGDNTVSPFEYLKCYWKGIVIASSFTVIYGWLGDICYDFLKEISSIIDSQAWNSYDAFLNGMTGVFMFVYAIYMIYFYIHFLVSGIRMLFLRTAIPLACVGLIDNDNGIYSTFIKKLTQTAITVVAQILLAQLSTFPLKVDSPTGSMILPLLISIAILSYGVKIASDLNDIFLASPTTGAGHKASAIGRGIQTATSIFKKK